MKVGISDWLFLNEFVRHPLQIASFRPSSKSIVEEVLADVLFEDDGVFVEFGAGTGVIAKEICRRMSDSSICVAIEPNSSFVDVLCHESSRMKIIQDYAENAVDKILELYGPADLIVAGLPFSMMSDEKIKQIISGARILLRTDGELRLFFYAHSLVLPKIQRMFDYVLEDFKLTWTKITWNTMPPMAIVRCVQ